MSSALPRFDLSALDDGRLTALDGKSFVVADGALDLPCRLKLLRGARVLFVMLNGAVDRTKVSLPVFARWNWGQVLGGHVLSVCDPTLYLDDELRLGWFVGNRTTDPMQSLLRMVETTRTLLGVADDHVVFYGSSGGGYASIVAAAARPHGRAIAANPQTEILAYHAPSVERLAAVFRPGWSPQQCRRRFPLRWSALEAIAEARRQGRDLRIVYAQNTADVSHHERHFRPFCDAVDAPLTGGTSTDDTVLTHVYSSPEGHATEPPAVVRFFAQEGLAHLGVAPPDAAEAHAPRHHAPAIAGRPHFPGARGLTAAELPEGRFSARLDSGHFECFIRRREGKRLFVVLSGSRNPESPLPGLPRANWTDSLPGSVLCVVDPAHELANARFRAGWYVGTDGHNWQLRLVGLVRTIAAKLGVEPHDIVCCGANGAGFGALMLAAHLKEATALAINPDVNLLKLPGRLVEGLLGACFSGRSAAELTPAERARLSAAIALRRAPAARCLVIQDIADTQRRDMQFAALCAAIGVGPDGGSSACGRRVARLIRTPEEAPEPSKLPVVMWIEEAVALSATATAVVPAVTSPARQADAGAMPRITASQLYLIRNPRQPLDPRRAVFSPRADVPVQPIDLPLDWSTDPFNDRNWCAQLHMWRMLDNYILEFERTGDSQWMAVPMAVIDDWHAYHVQRRRKSKFAWMDMMVGMRAMKLAFLLSAARSGAIVLGAERLARYRQLADQHLDFLLDPANIAYSNHTFADMHGLAALGSVSEEPRKAQIDEFLRQVMPRLLASQFDAAGVHLENSTGYQLFGIGCVKRLVASGWFADYGVDDLLQRATAVDALFKLPDGRCVPIGDTDGAAMPRAVRTAFTARRELIDQSGYVIFRDDGRGRCARASYLFFMAAFTSRYHKQCDDLSLVWYEGEDILCDAGKYAYKAGEMQDYVRSSRAHNTIEVDGDSPSPDLSHRPDLVYGSAVRQAQSTGWGCIISAQVGHKPAEVVHTRHLLYGHRSWLLVIDRVDGEREHEVTQWSHFSPHLAVERVDATRMRTQLRSGRRLDVIVGGSTPAGPQLSLVQGQLEPVRQGWISQSYGELTPNAAVGSMQRGRTLVFVTLYVIDDNGSSVRLTAEDVVELDVQSNQGSKQLSVRFAGAQCKVTRPRVDVPPESSPGVESRDPGS